MSVKGFTGLAQGPNVIKLFLSVNYELSYYAGAFVRLN
jgi:hypothetical protein